MQLKLLIEKENEAIPYRSLRFLKISIFDSGNLDIFKVKKKRRKTHIAILEVIYKTNESEWVYA